MLVVDWTTALIACGSVAILFGLALLGLYGLSEQLSALRQRVLDNEVAHMRFCEVVVNFMQKSAKANECTLKVAEAAGEWAKGKSC